MDERTRKKTIKKSEKRQQTEADRIILKEKVIMYATNHIYIYSIQMKFTLVKKKLLLILFVLILVIKE